MDLRLWLSMVVLTTLLAAGRREEGVAVTVILTCLDLSPMLTLVVALSALGAASLADALPVYDCGEEKTTYEVIDLVATRECPARAGAYLPAVTEKVQVLHTEPRRRIKALQCRLVLTKFVTTCDMIDYSVKGPFMTQWRTPTILEPLDCKRTAEQRYYKTGEWGDRIRFEMGVPATAAVFTRGKTDEYGWVWCRWNFKSGAKTMSRAYEQTMVEVTVGYVYGDLDQDRGVVTFGGVSEMVSKGCLLYTSPSPRDRG